MKTFKTNWIKCLYLLLIMTLLIMVPHIANSQTKYYDGPTWPMLVGSTDSRLVFTLEETDATVMVRVMMVGPFGLWTQTTAISYDSTVLTATNPTYTLDCPSFVGSERTYVSRASRVGSLYPAFTPDAVTIAPINTPPLGAVHDMYYQSVAFLDLPPSGHDTLKAIRRPAGELLPLYNLHFRKNHPGTPLQKTDLGFMGESILSFDGGMHAIEYFNYWSGFSRAIGYLEPWTTGLFFYIVPNLFVFRSPSDVVTDPATNIQVYTADLNANFKRGDFGTANDMYVSKHNSSDQTGRINWDDVHYYGLFYSVDSADIYIDDISDSITVNGTLYPFPTKAEIVSAAGAPISIDGIDFYFIEFPENLAPDGTMNYTAYDAPLPYSSYDTMHYVWSYIRYSFETSNTYLQVDGPVRLKKLINCDALGDVKFVQENVLGGYTHGFDDLGFDKPGIDTTWDANTLPYRLVARLDSAKFVATNNSGVVLGTGTSLDGFTFTADTTVVKWIAYMDELTDTCEFMVIFNNSILECDSTPNRYVQEDFDGAGHYTHSGFNWDVKVKTGFALSDSSYVATGALVATGKTLDNAVFPVGITHVKWYGTNDADGSVDSCEFDVTVNPVHFMACGLLNPDYYAIEDSLGYYTHHGVTWDAIPDSLYVPTTVAIVLDSLYYVASEISASGMPALPLTGAFSLDTVKFPVGTTLVKWIGKDEGGYLDTCEITITVYPKEFMDCPSIGTANQTAKENESGFYKHSGTTWDVDVVSSMGVAADTTFYYISDKAVPTTGSSLDTVHFPLGVTTVKWYGVITSPQGDVFTDTCATFTVTVTADALLVCTEDQVYYVQEPTAGAGYTQSGATWDAVVKLGVTVTDTVFVTEGLYGTPATTPTTGHFTLDGVNFPVGTTLVKWIATDASLTEDTCEFTVVVLPKQDVDILNCSVIGNKDTVETSPKGYYTHNNTNWNVGILSSLTGFDSTFQLDTAYFTTTTTGGKPAIPATGKTLNGVQFPLDTTTVVWTGIIRDPNGGPDFVYTCDFYVAVHPNYLMECDSIGGDQDVQVDAGLTTYTHSGADWDPTPRQGVNLVAETFKTTGATVMTGSTTLSGKVFNLGTTRVKWFVTDDMGTIDSSCYFDVTVYSRDLTTNCSTMTDQVADENGNGYYVHSGSAWDITPKTGATITGYAIGATQSMGATTLNAKQFPLGTTLVKWFAKQTTTNGVTFYDTCEYSVTVVPTNLTLCPATPNKTVPENNTGYYEHTGTGWDISTITLANLTYTNKEYDLSALGLLASTSSLNAATFQVGITHVKYIVEADYVLPDLTVRTIYDTCEFDVQVTPLSLLDCTDPAMYPKRVDESAPMSGYDHTGSGWDAVLSTSAFGLTVDVYYKVTTPDATIYNGAIGQSLDGFNFPVGVSTVVWYAEEFGTSRVNSCSFKVTVDPLLLPVLDCSQLPKPNPTVLSDTEGAIVYTHSGTTWDAQKGDPATILASLIYRLDGATTGTGTSLDGVEFHLGKTTVTWIGTDVYNFVDSCKFIVTVDMRCPSSVAYEGGPYNVTPLAGLCWTDNMANRNYDGAGAIAFARAYTCSGCDSTTIASIFGLLYTWYSAVNVPEGSSTLPTIGANGHVQGICPTGYHVPSQTELNLLNLYPMADLKSTDYWMVPGTNTTGFNALPAGKFNDAINRFEDLYGSTGYWTSYDNSGKSTTFYNMMSYYCSSVQISDILKSAGLSVRCIMDY